jgi:hypothetical protein
MKSILIKAISTFSFFYFINLCNPDLNAAQSKVTEERKTTHGFYGGPIIETIRINGQGAILGGIQAGWVLRREKHSFGIVPTYKRLINQVKVQQNNYGDTLYLNLTYIGLGLSYTYKADKQVSYTFINDIFTGLSDYHFGNFSSDLHSGYTIYLMKPGVLINYNVLNSMKVSTGLVYNLVSSSDHFLLSSKQLSGLSGTLRITFRKVF